MKIIGDHENLKEEILADAERKKEQAITKAEREVRKIQEESQADAEKEYLAIINQANEKAKDISERILASIPQAVKRKKIEMFNSLVDNVMDEIYKRILTMKKEEARDIEIRQLKEALASLDQGEYVVYINPESRITQKDLNELAKPYSIKCTLEKDAEIQLGVRVNQSGTKMFMDYTVEGKWKREMEDIRYSVYELLFSE